VIEFSAHSTISPTFSVERAGLEIKLADGSFSRLQTAISHHNQAAVIVAGPGNTPFAQDQPTVSRVWGHGIVLLLAAGNQSAYGYQLLPKSAAMSKETTGKFPLRGGQHSAIIATNQPTVESKIRPRTASEYKKSRMRHAQSV